MTRVGVLGDGITAKAVHAFLRHAEHYEASSINDADIIVTSPGIPPHQWPSSLVDIVSDIEFGYRIMQSRGVHPTIIGVTGTNGKTTVATGLGHVLGCPVYGNIGVPFIQGIDQMCHQAPVVIELSSFQLATSPTLACDIAIITNIESDHLDWHGSMAHYQQSKWGIARHCKVLYAPKRVIQAKTEWPEGRTVVAIDALSHDVPAEFSSRHNRDNARIILDVAHRMGVPVDWGRHKLADCPLPPYRCQTRVLVGGRVIINDSKATNMAATLAAVDSLDGPTCLILAGIPKESYTDAFFQAITTVCHRVYVAGHMATDPSAIPRSWRDHVVFFDSLKEATVAALSGSSSDTILFSPSGASFDEFNDYMDRGRAFEAYVRDNE